MAYTFTYNSHQQQSNPLRMKNFTESTNVENFTNVIEMSIEDNSFPDKSNFPVLKIDTQGKIIYANHASFECLREWLNGKNAYLPKYVIQINPDVLNPNADFSISIDLKTDVVNFDVIGFKESGFIGLYGFNSHHPEMRNTHLHEIENS